MSQLIELTQQGSNQKIYIVKDKIKTFRDLPFKDRSGSARIITLMDSEEIWVIDSLEDIQRLMED